jgi:hypothetical protein
MSNENTQIELEVKTGSPPDSSWKKCTDSSGNEIDFSCRYSGGDWSSGGAGAFQAIVGEGAKTAHLTLNADHIWQPANPNSYGFRIEDVEIEPPNSDCSLQGGGTASQRQIVDKAENIQEGTYTVIVAHKTEDGQTITEGIHCDPGWRNTGGGR